MSNLEHSLPSKIIGNPEYFNSTDPEIVEERESLRETIMQYQREKDARAKVAALEDELLRLNDEVTALKRRVAGR